MVNDSPSGNDGPSRALTREGVAALNAILTVLQEIAGYLQAASPGFLVGTVADLPATAAIGTRWTVTDANATTFHAIVAGGGANTIGVQFDGTNWRIGA